METLSEHDGGTLLKRSMHLWGTVSEETEKMYREGSRILMEESLRDYCERGIGYVPPTGDQ